jgi:hypothetical protein
MKSFLSVYKSPWSDFKSWRAGDDIRSKLYTTALYFPPETKRLIREDQEAYIANYILRAKNGEALDILRKVITEEFPEFVEYMDKVMVLV